MWIGRRDLRDRRVRAGLVLAGAGTGLGTAILSAVLVGRVGEPAGWERLTVQNPHSQMPLWLLGATGVAVLVLGVALVVADLAGRLLWPVVAMGQLALTIYVAQLVALHFARETLSATGTGRATVLVGGLAVTGMLFATAWRALFTRGPIELAIHLPFARRTSPSGTGAQ
jgi:uncharacterized membrane protein YeiB